VTHRQKSAPFLDLTSCRALFTLAALAFALLTFASAANASKQAVDFFGGNGTAGGQFGDGGGVAVNETGAGPANQGDVYALDPANNRIERFGRDDNGTPANTADDTYFFISAWGADVDSTSSGGSDYEICIEAARCQAAVASGGNGSAAGNGTLGSLDSRSGAALDQDTGNLYVADSGNFRVNVYDGTGTFLRSFGYDIIASGPDDAGTGYEVCVAADGDVCKTGLYGAGTGQIGLEVNFGAQRPGARGVALSAPDGNPATGTVFLADSGNRRIDTYALDGSGPTSFGSGHFPEIFLHNNNNPEPTAVAVDSRGIVYIGTGAGGDDPRIERYDSQNANGGGIGFLTPIFSPRNEEQVLTEEATAGTFRLTFGGKTTTDLSFNADRAQVEAALEALSSIGPGNVKVVRDIIGEGGIALQIIFQGALAQTDVAQLVLTNGTTPLNGSIPVTTTYNGHPGLAPSASVLALAVDPDTDGAGSDTDILYAERGQLIQQFGPLNPAGLSAPPGAVDDTHGTSKANSSASGLAVEPSTGRLYAAGGGGEAGPGVYVLDNAGPPATAVLDSCDNITFNAAGCHATINPNGLPASRYHFEYSIDGVNWVSTPEEFLGAQETPQAIDFTLNPPPIGLDPKTEYHVRVVDVRRFATPVTSNELTFTTAPVSPLVETAGAPVRTTTTAQLNGRVTPLGSAATYHFEYGTEGPCASSPCTSTPTMPAGSGQLSELVAEEVAELQPDATYHYRLVAENGVGSPVMGADMTVHTRASNQLPNQSDTFPGPPGSDRAWEQVSIADSSGNPVGFGEAFSDDGNRAAYGIFGGTPISSTGSILSLYYSERTPSGWQTQLITPSRDQLAGQFWFGINGPGDLSTMLTLNEGEESGTREREIWRLTPDSGPTLLFQRALSDAIAGENFGISADGSHVLAFLKAQEGVGTLDPAYPAAAEHVNIYDISFAAPQLISLLPGNMVSPCGAPNSFALEFPGSHWVAADGSLAYFESSPTEPCKVGSGGFKSQLYLREIDVGQTKRVSGPPLSGPDCGGSLIKAIPGAVFFATHSRLDPADSESTGCSSSNDIYRYDNSDGSLKCVTCVISGFSLDVEGSDPTEIAVSDDGSRVYFKTTKRLLPGAPPDGQQGVYRVNVQSGELAYVASLVATPIGPAQNAVEFSVDGSTLAFSSKSASLNPLGGTTDNNNGIQYYRYRDSDRSLICVTCPQDGSAPAGQLESGLHIAKTNPGVNRRALSADGNTFAFATPTPLVGADQNTPGPGHSPKSGIDVYEWRDGRLLLITDGLTNWTEDPASKNVRYPVLEGITPSGNDIYFTATAAYTPDAPDALNRLYDARIGGGISFPPPPPPCPLEVCQGIPKGAPEEQEPASRNFSGPGNTNTEPTRDRCPKGKHKASRAGKARCVKLRKHRHRRAAKHNRGAHR
jgi:hypothetical protein